MGEKPTAPTPSQTQTQTQTQPQTPKSVLFVCLGNICRSPMAEGVFTHLTQPSHPLISRIDSCGTGAYHTSEPPDPRTTAVLAAHGIAPSFYASRARARKLAPSDFGSFDYIFAMDAMNLADLREARARAVAKGVVSEERAGRVALLGAFGGRTGREEVGDPYYGGKAGFEVAFEQVERCGRGFLRWLETGEEPKGFPGWEG